MTPNGDEDELIQPLHLQSRNSARQQSVEYLAEAQRLSHTGSFAWKPDTGKIVWSQETFRIFQYEQTTTPTIEMVLQRVHSDDAAFVQQTMKRAAQDGKDFEQEYRLLMPDGSAKYVHVVPIAKRSKRSTSPITRNPWSLRRVGCSSLV